ncbi:MAG: glycosyltransferase family 4 protein [Vicinamibacterales bacterium]
MRILFVTQVLPLPLDAGPKVRAYYVLRYLAEAGHEVHLASFVRPGDREDHVATLRRLCASVETVPMVRSRFRDARDGVRSLWSRTPFLVLRDDLPAMRQAIARLAETHSFDALHADQLWMAPYGMNDDLGIGLRVLDQHNAVFQVPRRMAGHHRNLAIRAVLHRESSRLEAYEREACRRFDRVAWVTEEDRRAVLGAGADRGTRDVVIPIAADPAARPRMIRSRPFRVTFLGGLHWPPNREGAAWFLERIWPRVAEAVPTAVLTVLGRGGSDALPRAHEYRRVEVTGYVDDPRPYLAETAAFIVPLKSGAGMRVKILDAWCWGVPVVSTTVGAEGLHAAHDENLLLADDEDAFADAVIRLIRDRGMAGRLADNGRATVEHHYDWRKVYTAWDDVYSRRREPGVAQGAR